LQKQVSEAIKSFYCKTQNRFHRSLLRLDDLENYNDFMHSDEQDEDNIIDSSCIEQSQSDNMEKVQALLPHLPKEQQLIIGFCLKYNFNYERIAYYLGGISDYEVCLKVERSIALLKTILLSDSKIAAISHTQHIAIQGQFDHTQAEIFRMRYELQLSFEEIATALKLEPTVIKRLFVHAYAQIKKSKQTA
jgi:DNA-directed RNA polymerase specialized sigma24 family protein